MIQKQVDVPVIGSGFGGLQVGNALKNTVLNVLLIAKLIGFRNQLMVFVSWIYNYFTYGSSARLILNLNDLEPEIDNLSEGRNSTPPKNKENPEQESPYENQEHE